MAVLGGAGYVWGGVAGAVIITLLREWLQDLLPALLGTSGNYEVVALGILIILTLQFARRGLWPLVERLVPAGPPRLLTRALTFPHRPLPAPGTEVLRVDHAVKQFGGLRAVNDVSFGVNAGEIVGLIGPNGAGKSTMFNLVTGVSPATSGAVTLLGRAAGRLPARTIHRLGVARTFQHVKQFSELSLLENAMMGGYARARAGMLGSLLHLERREEAALQQAALAQLGRVGLRDRAFDLAGNLALGQQRLLEIARALVADPAFLLLDEPAAGLRYGEKAELAALLRKLRDEGVTILIVEHDMDLVMGLVDRLVVMNGGQELAQGSPREVRANAAVREAYLGAEVGP
jgi:branched-chain amino acid transport system permease protein